MLVGQHVDLVLDSHSYSQELAVKRGCAEEVAAFGVGNVVGSDGGLGAYLDLLRVEFSK